MGQLRYETYRRRGRHWQYLGERDAETMRGAALVAGYVEHCKVVGVRPAGSLDKIYAYRFAYFPEVHHGK